jgi:tetratricopeptide (TPR) repeat protein
MALGNLGSWHLEAGSGADVAKAHYRQALAIHERLGERSNTGRVLGNIAGLLHEEGRLAEAEEMMERSLAIHREAGNRRSAGIVLGNLARLHADQGHLEEAWQLFGQALEADAAVGERRVIGHVLTQMAALARRTGDLARGSQLAAEAHDALLDVGDDVGLALLACERGFLALAARADPMPLFEEARRLAGRAQVPERSAVRRAIASLGAARGLAPAMLHHGEPESDVPPGLRDRLAAPGEGSC